MKEIPILFSGPMVRAILDDSKTQTRRVCKPMNAWINQDCREVRNIEGVPHHFFIGAEQPLERLRSPYGQPGDRLWVRETWMPGYFHDPNNENGPTVSLLYQADNDEQTVLAPSIELSERWDLAYSEDGDEPPRWRPSIHMPRWACRILLEVVSVQVERLQDISEADAIAEGVEPWTVGEGFWRDYSLTPEQELVGMPPRLSAKDSFRTLWDSLNAKRDHGWDTSPWVWVVKFKRVTP